MRAYIKAYIIVFTAAATDTEVRGRHVVSSDVTGDGAITGIDEVYVATSSTLPNIIVSSNFIA